MITKLRGNPASDTDFGVSVPNTEPEPVDRAAAGRAARLKAAVKEAGGNKAVVAKSGVPSTTLSAYLRGGEMKLGAAVALAEAAGVRLEWLATGEGPRRPLEAETVKEPMKPASNAAPDEPRTLFSQIDADRLATAYTTALAALAAHGHQAPEPRRIVQVMTLIYDELTPAPQS